MLTTITPTHGRQERSIMSHPTACAQHQLTFSAIIVIEHMVQLERRAFYTEWAELTGSFPTPGYPSFSCFLNRGSNQP